MDYKIFELESPIDKDSFDEFTKKEASIYFEWYMSVIDKRIKYIENYINAEEFYTITLCIQLRNLMKIG